MGWDRGFRYESEIWRSRQKGDRSCDMGTIFRYEYLEWEKIGINLICKSNFVFGSFKNKKWFHLLNFIDLIILYLKSYQNWKNLIKIDLILKFKYK